MDNFWSKQTDKYLYAFMRTAEWGLKNPTRLWLKKNIKGGKLLDVGCGSGIDYEYLKDRCTYVGLDITLKVIMLCKKLFPEGNWVVGNIEKLPFGDKSFDIILCRHVIEHLEDYKKAIDELKRVGKKSILILFHSIGKYKKVRIRNTSTYNNFYSSKLLKYIGSYKMIELPIVDKLLLDKYKASRFLTKQQIIIF